MASIRLRIGSLSEQPQQIRELRGVVFDMDGLLLDTERIYRTLFQELAREQGYELSDAGYLRMVGHRMDISKRVLAEEIGTPEPVDAMFEQLTERYHTFIATQAIPTRPGAMELIGLLRERGIPLALATSTYRGLTDAKLRNARLDNIFAATVCGDEGARGKPHPDPYLQAVRALSLPPEQAMALEDSPTGLQAAHSAGLFAVLVPDLVPPSASSRAMADIVVDSLHSVRERILPADAHSALPPKIP